ncbi:hypothetical protein TSAR_015557 [Trichomalopsis sarcophagae]|uniref:Nuclear receptor coactivator 4 N-terminal domain-containing protein n=1 Tax=Trichomalopsis sarcophagae TaxID=543379 RepID=A0A232EGW9_9HYME|nr:hypothetical protein TSAR_015557 [Trichomalopsis sarcophagae]
MVGKDEGLGDIDDESLARVKLISDKKKQLEESTDQVRQEIRSCFERLSDALRGREKQLLRQVEAIHRQQLSLVQSNSELLPCIDSSLNANLDSESQLLEQIRNFGKIELSNSIAVNDTEPYKVEEYIEAGEDYVSFDKSLKKESEEFDVSSVIRYRKRDSSGNHGKTISINLNCTSCDSCKYETDSNSKIGVATTTKKLDESPVSPLPSPSCSTSSASSSEKQSPVKESEEELASPTEPESPVAAQASEEAQKHSENYYFGENHSNSICNNTSSPVEKLDDESKDASSKATVGEDESAGAKAQDIKAKDGGAEEHPIQIQQWLQQILAETETEPIIHEIGHISKIPNARLYREFPVET